jgi:hypothetical protein
VEVFLNTTTRLEHEVARAGWIGDFFDPATFLDMFATTGGNNNTGWSPPAYRLLIQRALASGERGRRLALFREAETMLNDAGPIIPIYHYSFNGLAKPYIRASIPTTVTSTPCAKCTSPRTGRYGHDPLHPAPHVRRVLPASADRDPDLLPRTLCAGGPFDAERKMNAQAMENMKKKHGLDKPCPASI